MQPRRVADTCVAHSLGAKLSYTSPGASCSRSPSEHMRRRTGPDRRPHSRLPKDRTSANGARCPRRRCGCAPTVLSQPRGGRVRWHPERALVVRAGRRELRVVGRCGRGARVRAASARRRRGGPDPARCRRGCRRWTYERVGRRHLGACVLAHPHERRARGSCSRRRSPRARSRPCSSICPPAASRGLL